MEEIFRVLLGVLLVLDIILTIFAIAKTTFPSASRKIDQMIKHHQWEYKTKQETKIEKK